MKKWIQVGLVVAMVFFSWSRMQARAAIAPVSPSEALELKNAGKATIVDVREQDEIREGMIDGARWIPLSSIQENGEAFKKEISNLDRSRELFPYCRSGRRSAQAGAVFQNLGFKVRNLGAFSDWKKAGFPVIQPQ